MMTVKQIAILVIVALMLFPAGLNIAQNFQPETVLQEDNTATETGQPEKKDTKKKESKILEMNEKFLISLAINLLNVALIILLVYYPNYRKLDYIFTFIIFNLIIFLLTFVMKYVKLSVGAAFGLFAVFSMLRYRTLGLSIRDLTYMFIFIAMGVISAIQLEYMELCIIHAIIFTGTFVLDSNVIFRQERLKTIRYENIEMIKPEHHTALIEDLKSRTGLNIHRIVIGKINFLKDEAVIRVYYYD